MKSDLLKKNCRKVKNIAVIHNIFVFYVVLPTTILYLYGRCAEKCIEVAWCICLYHVINHETLLEVYCWHHGKDCKYAYPTPKIFILL